MTDPVNEIEPTGGRVNRRRGGVRYSVELGGLKLFEVLTDRLHRRESFLTILVVMPVTVLAIWRGYPLVALQTKRHP